MVRRRGQVAQHLDCQPSDVFVSFSPLVFITDDARGLYETLKSRGVTDFTQEPTDHFYGTDMGIRDPFGNAIRILQPAKVAAGATA